MVALIFIIILAALAVTAFILSRAISRGFAKEGDEDEAKAARVIGGIVSAVLAVVALIILFFSTFWQNGVGEAKVIVNGVDRTIVGTIDQPGAGFKAPWEDFVDFDLFSQELKFAGAPGSAPSYSGGSVNGAEVTVSVGGISGGSTQGNTDFTVTYSIDADAVADIYSEFKSQERFTEQVVVKQFLSIARQVPAEYTATGFRGVDRAEAEQAILTKLNARLAEWGVDVSTVTVQDVRYPESVEEALKAVEVANQQEQKAQAELRAAEVTAQQKVVEAQAEADANAILSASLTPEVLQQRYLDTLGKLAAAGNLVITDGTGSGVLIQR